MTMMLVDSLLQLEDKKKAEEKKILIRLMSKFMYINILYDMIHFFLVRNVEQQTV